MSEVAYWEDVAARYEKALRRITGGEVDFLYEAQDVANEALSATQPLAALAAAPDGDIITPPEPVGVTREALQQIVEDAMNSAISEPWEVSAHAADRILSLIALAKTEGRQ